MKKKASKNPVEEMGDLLVQAKRIGFEIRNPGSLQEMRNFVDDITKAQRDNRRKKQ